MAIRVEEGIVQIEKEDRDGMAANGWTAAPPWPA
jgi:hypothetical protein